MRKAEVIVSHGEFAAGNPHHALRCRAGRRRGGFARVGQLRRRCRVLMRTGHVPHNSDCNDDDKLPRRQGWPDPGRGFSVAAAL